MHDSPATEQAMPRDVTTDDELVWSCVEAYAGLSTGDDGNGGAPARADGEPVTVVCTPRGGAQSVRLELAADWERSASDDDLRTAIGDARDD